MHSYTEDICSNLSLISRDLYHGLWVDDVSLQYDGVSVHSLCTNICPPI